MGALKHFFFFFYFKIIGINRSKNNFNGYKISKIPQSQEIKHQITFSFNLYNFHFVKN